MSKDVVKKLSFVAAESHVNNLVGNGTKLTQSSIKKFEQYIK